MAITAATLISLLCLLLASAFLLSAVAFGLERGEMGVNPQPHLAVQARLNRAANVAVAGFMVLEIGATWFLTRWLAVGSLRKIPAGVRVCVIFVGVSLFSWSIVLLALLGLASDPLLVAQARFQLGSWEFCPKIRRPGDNKSVTDQLSLSLWLARNMQSSRLRQFEKLLRLFPFSQRPQPQSIISIQAVDAREPALLERPVNGPVDPSEVMEIFQEYSGDDVAYHLESWWDLWRFNRDWKLAPARVSLACFGPEFDNRTGKKIHEQEDLRIDFGVDSYFLPQPEITGSAKLVESNIKSLLRLVHELDSALPVEKRRLETESGENFASRLQETLAAEGRM